MEPVNIMQTIISLGIELRTTYYIWWATDFRLEPVIANRTNFCHYSRNWMKSLQVNYTCKCHCIKMKTTGFEPSTTSLISKMLYPLTIGTTLLSRKIILVLIHDIGWKVCKESTHVIPLYQNNNSGIWTQYQSITLYTIISLNTS